jgi:hypothetical protein
MQFAGFDVENRPRVKCVTASQGDYLHHLYMYFRMDALYFYFKRSIKQIQFHILNTLIKQPVLKIITGVPITTQWDPKGYYYPTQVCQYALAHWSKYVQEKTFKMTVYEDGDLHQVKSQLDHTR